MILMKNLLFHKKRPSPIPSLTRERRKKLSNQSSLRNVRNMLLLFLCKQTTPSINGDAKCVIHVNDALLRQIM